MSSLAPCGECEGTGKKGKKMCEWCEGTGQIEIPDGFRPRKKRTKADLKRIKVDQRTPIDSPSLNKPDATLIKPPPARGSRKREE